jgi:hypothetical protein
MVIMRETEEEGRMKDGEIIDSEAFRRDAALHDEILDNPEAENLTVAMSRASVFADGWTKEEVDQCFPQAFVPIDENSCCHECAHYHGDSTCDAFPYGIPPAILLSWEDHFEPYEGDHRIQISPA